MDLYSVDNQQRKQRRIENYSRARDLYSAKGRKAAVKFERSKLFKKRIHAIAKLNEELKHCHHIYLNCFNEIGSAHRLGDLIEKLEQFAISNQKSTDSKGK